MSEQLSISLILTLIILVIIAAWAATIAFVYRDTQRRNLAGWQRFIWRVLVLFPVVGFVAYLIVRQLAVPIPGQPAGAARPSPQRVTFLKPSPPAGPKRLPTIPAAEYLRAAELEKHQAPRRGELEERPACILAAIEGPYAGREFVIKQLPASIGRGPDCTLQLDEDRGVSRRHAELYRQGSALRLRDLGSTHGTNINGNVITDKRLELGDRILVGYSLLTVKRVR
jgi:hypothetical protein